MVIYYAGLISMMLTVIFLLVVLHLNTQNDKETIAEFIRQNRKPNAKERIKQIERIHKEEIAELKAEIDNLKNQ